MLKHIVTIAISCGLFACATTDSGETTAATEGLPRGSDCISQGTIRDYTVLDDSNLIVRASGRRAYHVQLSRPVWGIKSAWQLGFESRTGQICSSFSDVIVDDKFSGDRVRISSVRRLTPEDEEDLKIRFGKVKPKQEQPREPEPVEGAEVEELD
ncbi:MAG: hypothetical protein KJO82_10225 [Gammaproteobacteria bacterium]|nr:hypothetical protein [Gammaproteobacteria bacterium]